MLLMELTTRNNDDIGLREHYKAAMYDDIEPCSGTQAARLSGADREVDGRAAWVSLPENYAGRGQMKGADAIKRNHHYR